MPPRRSRRARSHRSNRPSAHSNSHGNNHSHHYHHHSSRSEQRIIGVFIPDYGFSFNPWCALVSGQNPGLINDNNYLGHSQLLTSNPTTNGPARRHTHLYTADGMCIHCHEHASQHQQEQQPPLIHNQTHNQNLNYDHNNHGPNQPAPPGGTPLDQLRTWQHHAANSNDGVPLREFRYPMHDEGMRRHFGDDFARHSPNVYVEALQATERLLLQQGVTSVFDYRYFDSDDDDDFPHLEVGDDGRT